LVASYDLRPGNGAGPIFWKVRDRRRNRREGKTLFLWVFCVLLLLYERLFTSMNWVTAKM